MHFIVFNSLVLRCIFNFTVEFLNVSNNVQDDATPNNG